MRNKRTARYLAHAERTTLKTCLAAATDTALVVEMLVSNGSFRIQNLHGAIVAIVGHDFSQNRNVRPKDYGGRVKKRKEMH